MAAVTGAMTQEARAADNNSDERETVHVPVCAVNEVIASLARTFDGASLHRYARPLAEEVRGRYGDEFVTLAAESAKMGLAFCDDNSSARAFDAALAGLAEWGTTERSINERLATMSNRSRWSSAYPCEGSHPTYENLSRE